MEAKGLEALERIAGNLPVTDLTKGTIETKRGRVWIALGRGPGIEFEGMAWHGVYAIEYGGEQGLARTGECDGELTLEEAQQQFLDDACWFMAQFDKRHMLDESFTLNA
jgi:hypothetical protein